MVVEGKILIRESSVEQDKIILPQMHTKLGCMKQFWKALDQDGRCSGYILWKMPRIIKEKLKAGNFNGPEIWQLLNDPGFVDCNDWWWAQFVDVIRPGSKIFNDNHKAQNCAELVNNMLSYFRDLVCNVSINFHYLHSFLKSLGDMREEQGERFHEHFEIM